jgi:hypothetical protein
MISPKIQEIFDMLERSEISSGRGLDEGTCLTRPKDTRWGSHYTTFFHIHHGSAEPCMFSMRSMAREVLGIRELLMS